MDILRRGCGGCSSWFRGLARQPHTEACRERFRGLMREDAKVKNQEERKKYFEDREIEKKKKKRDIKKEGKKRKIEEERDVDDEEPKTTSSGSGIKRDRDEEGGDMDISIVESLVENWVTEIQELCDEGIEE